MSDEKRFKIVNPGTDEDVLGGEFGEGHVYISMYGSILPGEKRPADLEVGEGSLMRYSLSGTQPTTYKVVRTA